MASTSSTPPASASAVMMPDNASADAKPKGKGKLNIIVLYKKLCELHFGLFSYLLLC